MQQTETTTTLNTLKPGMKCRVIRNGLKGPVRRRMMDMGLTAGAEVQIVRLAPLGDPMELKVRDFLLSVRKDDAAKILVEPLDE